MKRDNTYYMTRLKRAGRDDLLEQVYDGKMSVYKATIEAGIRKKRSASSRSSQLSYHWSRADKRQRTRFMIDNFEAIDLLRKELVARVEQKHAKAQ